ncbi:hypothetical protein [Paenibacillus turicensis]|nr:hypothetical protein [Paenibacillus turicensis]
MYWIIPVPVISLLLYVELIIAEKKSTAFILQSEIIINRVLAFGLFVHVIRKQLSVGEVEALQDYFTLLEQKGDHQLSSYAINRLASADIVFYRNEHVFP